MYSTKSYQLTKEEYNYLLAVKREQLYTNRETYSIITNEIEEPNSKHWIVPLERLREN